YLKSEIEQLIQSGYLQEYIYWKKARGMGPYQKYETDKDRNVKNPSPKSPVKDIPRSSITGKAEVNDPPRKGMARNAELSRHTLGEAYDQMQLEDVPLEAADTSPFGFAGEVVHPRSMISLPLTLGTSSLQKTYLLMFLVVDIPSAYNFILGRPTFNAFRAIISTYHMKIKFPMVEGVGEGNPNKRGKDPIPRPEPKDEAPVTVKPVKELLTVELTPGDQGRVTKIRSKMKEDIRDQVVDYLRKNKDIFVWIPQDLEGIDPGVITHHLNLDFTIKPVKQKKRHFGPEKDNIIQEEVNKLLIDQLVDSTSGCKLLSMMDALQEYHQIMLALEDHKRVSFITLVGTFCFVTMPFGLKNAGATYQRLVDKIFRSQLGRNIEVYVDDMLVKSKEAHQHVEDLEEMFVVLRK
ncbi:UNVERIFIED_CONTAM: hypothetical protein Sradi_5262300, partial [Sesamum radiatum]